MKKKTKKNKDILNSKTRDIIVFLDRKGGGASAHYIADKSGMSYITVTKYLDILVKKGIVLVRTNPAERKGKIKIETNSLPQMPTGTFGLIRQDALLPGMKKRKHTKRGKTKRYTLNYDLINRKKEGVLASTN